MLAFKNTATLAAKATTRVAAVAANEATGTAVHVAQMWGFDPAILRTASATASAFADKVGAPTWPTAMVESVADMVVPTCAACAATRNEEPFCAHCGEEW